MRSSPHAGTSAADRLRLTGIGPTTRLGSGSSASAASLARSPSVGRVPSAGGRCTSRGSDMSCGKEGVSEATWTGGFGCVRNWWNSAICATSSLSAARARRTSSGVIEPPSLGWCWVRPLGKSKASSVRGRRGQARTRSVSRCTNGVAEVG